MAGYFLMMVTVAKHVGTTTLLLTYVIYNLGLALSFSNVLTSGLESLPIQLKGDGNALFNATQIYGGAVGTCLLALIISFADQLNRSSSKTFAMQQGGQWCFIFLFAVIVITILCIRKSFKKN